AAARPNAQPFAFGEIVARARLGPRRPVSGHGDPRRPLEKPGLRDETAADASCRIRLDARPLLDAREARAERGEAPDSVRFPEGLPGEPVRQNRETGKVAETGNRIVRRLQLEEKRRPYIEPRERSARRAPKVRVLRRFDAQSEGPPLTSAYRPGVGGRSRYLPARRIWVACAESDTAHRT